jgi:hypothetical protein
MDPCLDARIAHQHQTADAIVPPRNTAKFNQASHAWLAAVVVCCCAVVQDPWIQNATLRNNVLMGHSFEQGAYDAAIHAACLGQDLEVRPQVEVQN